MGLVKVPMAEKIMSFHVKKLDRVEANLCISSRVGCKAQVCGQDDAWSGPRGSFGCRLSVSFQMSSIVVILILSITVICPEFLHAHVSF